MQDKLWSYVYMTWIFIKCLTLNLIDLFVKRTPKDVAGKVVLITGGAKGLGRAMADCFVKNGCKIALVDVDDKNGVKSVNELLMQGVEAKYYSVDVSDYQAVEKLRENVERDLGPVEILINNAAILFCDPILDSSPEFLQKFVNINQMSHFWTTKVFLPGMLERKSGHIVAISSGVVLITLPYEIAYTATKFAVAGFMKALNIDLHMNRQDYVKTTTVFPHFVKTRSDLVDSYMRKLRVKTMNELTVGPRFTAKKIVEGILTNKEKIVIPEIYANLARLNGISDRFWKETMMWMYDREAECPNRPQGRYLVKENGSFVIPSVINKHSS